MALILCIETSTKSCSVALSQNGKSLQTIELVSDQYSHSEKLTLFIEKLLQEQKKSFSDLDAVAVSKGPGSYTGLRIGVSTAKGICYAIDKPLIAISTLEAMAFGMSLQFPDATYCPMLDARRMEVYCAFYGKLNSDIEAKVLDEDSFKFQLDKNPILFFGDGANKFQEICKHTNATFIANIYPSADNMSVLAQKAFNQKMFEDVAYFEPFYLKDFVAGPHKK
jgi:tRNA threonylcarbamoyladenosine biosynthesis protein TsaB